MIKSINKACSKSNNNIDFRKCIAKTESVNSETVPGMTVYEHAIITGFVAEALYESLEIKKYGILKEDVVLLAALHDVGKVSAPFQCMIADALEGYYSKKTDESKLLIKEGTYDGNHSEISQKAIKKYFQSEAAGFIVGNHHGRIINQYPASDDKASFFGGIEFKESRDLLIKEISETYKKSSFDRIENLSSFQKLAISGFVTVSDWISSSIPKRMFMEKGKSIANEVVSKIGMSKPQTNCNLTFADIFGFKPKNIQCAFYESVRESGIYILESEMGSGKTEAALFAAYKLISSGKASGIYFGLPTILTSLKMKERVDQFISVVEKNPTESIFSSSMKGYTDIHKDLAPGGSWFDYRKRTLLASFGVGTIDQALMSVINVKHSNVRAFGLQGKVVILDEVHSYDFYTSNLLIELIKALREVGSTVILLSATLNSDLKKNLLQCTQSFSSEYPLVTAQYSDQINEYYVGSENEKDINIAFESEEQNAINSAIDMALKGAYVLWIENTVDKAQDIYCRLASLLSDTSVSIGILHSRFTPMDRGAIEKKWVAEYGKHNNSRGAFGGCILVGTQVLEQSLDIDSDFLITRIAPVDMILQRAGRLWRHDRKDCRHLEKPCCVILAP